MTYTLDDLAQELNDLRLATFDYEFAWRLGCLMQAQAAARSLPAAITVAHGTDVVFALLMAGSHPRQHGLGGPKADRRPSVPSQLARDAP